MTTLLMIWIVLGLIGFAGSAMYSGLETGTYSLNRVRLHILDHQHHRDARAIQRLIARPTIVLSTLLIGNNVANQLGTSALSVLLDAWGLGPWEAVILNTLIVTPLLFIFGETLPKDLFAAHADRLMYRLAPVLVVSRWLFTVTGLIPLVSAFSWFLMKLIGSRGGLTATHPRRQVEFLVREGVGYGLLSDDQSQIVGRVLALGEETVADEMIPWRDLPKARLDDDPKRIRTLAESTTRYRVPVVDASGKPVGVLNLLHALLELPPVADSQGGAGAFPGIESLMAPIQTLPRNTPLREALESLRQRRVALAVVTDSRGQPIGAVTIKDLVEPITGELASW